MFEISRSCDREVRDYYSLTVDDAYVDRLNHVITAAITNPEDFKPLTVDEVKAIWENDDNMRIEEYTFKSRWDQGNTFTDSIASFVQDRISDDVWDYWVDSETLEEYEYEDEVIELESC